MTSHEAEEDEQGQGTHPWLGRGHCCHLGALAGPPGPRLPQGGGRARGTLHPRAAEPALLSAHPLPEQLLSGAGIASLAFSKWLFQGEHQLSARAFWELFKERLSFGGSCDPSEGSAPRGAKNTGKRRGKRGKKYREGNERRGAGAGKVLRVCP